MPIQIGAKSHSFANPTGLLSDCHRRVEMFLRSLRAVAETIDQPPTDDTRQALVSAIQYFAQAAPKHTSDEEDSLFPRMREINNAEIQTAFKKLDQLESDHRWAEPLHAEVNRLGIKYLANGTLSAAEIKVFRDSVASLGGMYVKHIGIEEEFVFPLADRLLSKEDKASIAQEMANRRNVPLVSIFAQRS